MSSTSAIDVAEVQRELASDYPELIVNRASDGRISIRGSFPVRFKGVILDRFQVEIELTAPIADEIPVVREIGGRIPRTDSRHVNHDGTACLHVPEEWNLRDPTDRTVRGLLEGPLHNFFLGQMSVEAGEGWPFGERSHGTAGLVQAYKEMVEEEDLIVVVNYLSYLTKERVLGHWLCPCGSGKIIRRCHLEKIRDLQARISPIVAERALQRLRTGSR